MILLCRIITSRSFFFLLRLRLSQYDVVITTYTIVTVENKKGGVLFGINWRRIILDEGHSIRNHKALTSVAVCKLEAKSRWVLTGTPVHNKELDLYALLKFLRCSPFDDLPVSLRIISFGIGFMSFLFKRFMLIIPWYILFD